MGTIGVKSAAKELLRRLGVLDHVRSLVHAGRRAVKWRKKSAVKKSAKSNFDLYEAVVNALHAAPAVMAVSKISSELVSEIERAIADGSIAECRLALMEDRLSDHLLLKVDSHGADVEAKLDANQTVLALHRFDSSDPLLSKIHEEVRSMFSSDVGSPFVIVNSRMWITKPGSEVQGPNAFHADGFASGHMKVMIYVSPLTVEDGYFEYKKGADVQSMKDLPAGTAILFRNSDVVHRGVPGKTNPRIAIEITLMRSTVDHPQAWPGHFYGVHLVEPTIFHHSRHRARVESFGSEDWRLNKVASKLKVNVGSGRRSWRNWLCFDELAHEGVHRVVFDSSFAFPLDNETVSLLYSSHCFEHLDEATLRQVLREMHRIGARDATFVLKIPDYEYFLEQYRRGQSSSMDGKGIESVLSTWDGRTDDTFENRIAMMFCGYWNKAYGDHFTGAVTMSRDAYHGPPIIEKEKLIEIFSSYSPNSIAKRLSEAARSDPHFGRFNHQSAWSRSEMVLFLAESGFRVFSTNTPLIVHRFKSEVPDVDFMQSWSAYFLAKKM